MDIKLASKEAHEAWEDFKVFLEQSGLVIVSGHPAHPATAQKFSVLQMAFKQGYVDGTRAAQEPAPAKKRRVYTQPKKMREHAQRMKDNQALEKILSSYQGSVALSDIIRRMQDWHYDHWTSNNASGFVKQAMNDGARVEKVSTGFYRYARDPKK